MSDYLICKHLHASATKFYTRHRRTLNTDVHSTKTYTQLKTTEYLYIQHHKTQAFHLTSRYIFLLGGGGIKNVTCLSAFLLVDGGVDRQEFSVFLWLCNSKQHT